MKTKGDVPVLILFLCVIAAGVPAWGGVPSAARGDAELSGRNTAALEKGCGCADVARTEIFRRKGLEYVISREFAEAMVAGASGTSSYSPAEVPASWRAVAAEWSAAFEAYYGSGTRVADASGSPPTPERTKYFEGAETCAPALLYLASLEFRARACNDWIAPVFPHVARASTENFRNGLAFRKGIRCFKD